MGFGRAAKRNFPGMKRSCPRCGETITVTAKMCERSQYTCATCESARAVGNAKRNPVKKRASNSNYRKTRLGKEAVQRKSIAYKAKHPEKVKARQIVQSAIRNGSLVRQRCQVCGSERVHAHHDDYSKPLNVDWLCHTHHMERHEQLRAREKGNDHD